MKLGIGIRLCLVWSQNKDWQSERRAEGFNYSSFQSSFIYIHKWQLVSVWKWILHAYSSLYIDTAHVLYILHYNLSYKDKNQVLLDTSGCWRVSSFMYTYCQVSTEIECEECCYSWINYVWIFAWSTFSTLFSHLHFKSNFKTNIAKMYYSKVKYKIEFESRGVDTKNIGLKLLQKYSNVSKIG